MPLGTKSYFSNSSTHVERSLESLSDLGYSLAIPWNGVYTTGWVEGLPSHVDGPVWGTERNLVFRTDPEYYAPGNIIRSNVIPEIDPSNPIYSFDRTKYTKKI
jgi:hypothetical protein